MSTAPTPDDISQVPLPNIFVRLRDKGYPPPERGFSSWEDWFYATLTRGSLSLEQRVAKLKANSPVPPSALGYATWEEYVTATRQKMEKWQRQMAQQQGAGTDATPPPGATPPQNWPQDWYWESSGNPPVGGITELPDVEESDQE